MPCFDVPWILFSSERLGTAEAGLPPTKVSLREDRDGRVWLSGEGGGSCEDSKLECTCDSCVTEIAGATSSTRD